MSKEATARSAMKLALGKIKSARDCHPNAVNTLLFEAEEILEEALEKPDFWEGYVPEPVKPAQQEFVSPGGGYVPAIPAQQALDKKAENARELGLDYEPAQQEPVAYIHRQGNHYEVSERFLSDDEKSRGWTEEPLYTSPPAQRTWVGLSDEELSEVYNQADWDTVNGWEYERAIEAKLRSKNEDRN
jgi:hypothetical protein